MDKAWKRCERKIAKRLNGQRVGPSGTSTADVVNPYLAVECKERKELPVWLKSAMSQAVAAAKERQLPVVVLHELGARHGNDLVVVRLGDFEDHMGTIWKREEEAS